MAQYNLWVPTSFIRQIRSNDQDTLVASMGLRVTNAEGALHEAYEAKSVHLGTHVADTNLDIYLFYSGVDVPDPTDESADGGAVCWSFILANAGRPDYSTLVDTITTAADGLAGALIGTATPGVVIGSAILGIDALARLLASGCDGAVASQRWELTAAQLARTTSGGAVWSTTQNYPGGESPLVCGAPSNYDVSYTITSQAPIRAPEVVGHTPQDAERIAHRAGLTLSIVDSSVSERVENPIVTYQNPTAGAVRPGGAAIDVAVTVPGTPKGRTRP